MRFRKLHPSEIKRIKRNWRIKTLIAICALLGVLFALSRWQAVKIDFWNGVFSGVVASAVFSALFYIVRLFSESLDNANRSEFANQVFTHLKDSDESGIISSSKKLDFYTVRDYIRKSDETVIVETWIDNTTFEEIREALSDALFHGSVKILLLNPYSKFVPERGKDTSDKKDAIENTDSIIETLRFLKKFWESENSIRFSPWSKPKLEVFCYDAPAQFSIYKWKTRAFVGFYFFLLPSSKGSQLLVDLDLGFGKNISGYIDKLLSEKSKKISLSQLDAELEKMEKEALHEKPILHFNKDTLNLSFRRAVYTGIAAGVLLSKVVARLFRK